MTKQEFEQSLDVTMQGAYQSIIKGLNAKGMPAVYKDNEYNRKNLVAEIRDCVDSELLKEPTELVCVVMSFLGLVIGLDALRQYANSNFYK